MQDATGRPSSRPTGVSATPGPLPSPTPTSASPLPPLLAMSPVPSCTAHRLTVTCRPPRHGSRQYTTGLSRYPLPHLPWKPPDVCPVWGRGRTEPQDQLLRHLRRADKEAQIWPCTSRRVAVNSWALSDVTALRCLRYGWSYHREHALRWRASPASVAATVTPPYPTSTSLPPLSSSRTSIIMFSA